MALPQLLPPGKTVRNIGGTNFLVSKSRSRRFKLPAKTRKKMAASARKFKVPVLTIAAVGVPTALAVEHAGGLTAAISTTSGFKRFGSRMLQFYTGFNPAANAGSRFNIRDAAVGLGPLAALTFIRRMGLFKGVNQTLARSRVPVRLA